MYHIVIFLIVGLAAGWLASRMLGGKDQGLVGSVVIGVIGAIVGGFVFDRLHIVIRYVPAPVDLFVAAFVGSVILLLLLRLTKHR